MGHAGTMVLTIIMPLKDHARLAHARDYFRAISDFRDSELAHKFNSLPDAERLAIAKEIARIRNLGAPSFSESRYVEQHIGWGLHTTIREHDGIAIIEAPR